MKANMDQSSDGCTSIARISDSQCISTSPREKCIDKKESSSRSQSPTSFIAKLPPEILHEIFAAAVCSPTVIHLDNTDCMKACSPVFPLTWVCSFWRWLILSRTAYWSSLEFHLSSLEAPANPAFITFLIDCISRSETAPISLKLNYTQISNLNLDQRRIIDHLCDRSTSWKELHIESSSLDVDPSLLTISQEDSDPLDMSSLEILELRIPARPAAKLAKYSILRKNHSFRHCPRLRHLSCYRFFTFDMTDLKNLTVLRIDVLVGAPVTEVLRRCPSLKRLELAGFRGTTSGWAGMFVRSTSTYRHACLSELELAFDCDSRTDYSTDYTAGAWDLLELPALTSLWMFFHPGCEPIVQEVEDMITLSNCSLSDLTLYHFPEKMVTDIVAGHPSLTMLFLHQRTVSEVIFTELTVVPSAAGSSAECNAPNDSVVSHSRIAPNLLVISLILENSWSAGTMFVDLEKFEEAVYRMVISRSGVLLCLRLQLPELPDQVLSDEAIEDRLQDVDLELQIITEAR